MIDGETKGTVKCASISRRRTSYLDLHEIPINFGVCYATILPGSPGADVLVMSAVKIFELVMKFMVQQGSVWSSGAVGGSRWLVCCEAGAVLLAGTVAG